MSDNREAERLRGDLEAAEMAIKAYQEQEIQLKAIADLAVKALHQARRSIAHKVTQTAISEINAALHEIDRISTEGVTPT